MKSILVVGQTPPPLHGQALMIEKMLAGNYKNIQLVHVRMDFSREIDEVGKFRFSKLVELLIVIWKIVTKRITSGAKVLYYPPAGPKKIPVMRDIAILISTRWLFEKIIFHFHASGLSDLYHQLPAIYRFLFRQAYFSPDITIRISEHSPDDGRLLQTQSEYIIPNGIEDEFNHFKDEISKRESGHILFVGALNESKGVTILLEACNRLKEKGIHFELSLMGDFVSDEYERSVKDYVRTTDLEGMVTFLGIRDGRRKWEAFAQSDIFCFPTFYESETLPIVLIEALCFELPIVSTRWRGIPSIVEDGYNGFLVSIQDCEAVSEKLEILITNPELRKLMGIEGRKKYLDCFTIEKFQRDLNKVFIKAVNGY